MPLNFSTSVEPKNFISIAAHLARHYMADLFLSGPGYPGENTCLIGIAPGDSLLVSEETRQEDVTRFVFSNSSPTFGFLSYTYGLKLHSIATSKTTNFPLGHLKKYKVLLVYDLMSKKLDLYTYGQDTKEVKKLILQPGQPSHDFTSRWFTSETKGPLTRSLDRLEYIQGVKKVLDYIRGGYTYQLNLSIKFSIDFKKLDPLALFLHLWRKNPAPFYVWLYSGQRRIISTSPERFLQVKNGEVLSQPIKGTLAFQRFNPSLISQLTDSNKEDAELSMIVDLIRNDISYNCTYGSVRVNGHKSTFIVDNLIQMYSNVQGRLREDRTCVDLLLDAFPGGSITGCPKKKSMEIIEELEPHARDIYCGTFFIIWDKKNMDSSIAIRTSYYDTGTKKFHFFAGSGIVIDSDPEKEYQETLAKAEKFLDIVKS
ncbi:chorismate-binding protein [Desulfovulcanus sp.]